MWYVIQTTTGKEQELVDTINKVLPEAVYKECFFLKRQLLKRLGGKWLEVTETLFPAYVFLEVDNYESVDSVFYELKKIPRFSKLLGDNSGYFVPLDESEIGFLTLLCGDTGNAYLVKATKVFLDSQGELIKLEGPLEYLKENAIKINLRKRYALVEIMLRGCLQTVLLGIRLEKD